MSDIQQLKQKINDKEYLDKMKDIMANDLLNYFYDRPEYIVRVKP